MYSLDNIYKSFDNNQVLKGVSLEIPKNKTTVLIGPSGSGKTTLLRCINLLEIPDSGTVTLNGSSMSFQEGQKVKYSGNEIRNIRMKTGMVFQNFQLFPHKTVLENIMEGPITDAYPGQLSGGQQQRIAIARALAMKPELLLFDEPTSALDPELEVEVLNIIRRLVDEKQTIVIITHKMSFAREVADKVVFFDEGKILKEGTYTELEQSNIPRITQFLNMLN